MIPTQTSPWSPPPQPILRDSLARLGIQRFVVAIHQASFPAGDDDLGHGTPYSAAGAAFAAWSARLGFDGIMLGPAGVTSRDNPSPYDGTALSRNPLHIAFGRVADDPSLSDLIDRDRLAAAIAGRPRTPRVAYAYAHDRVRELLASAVARAGASHRARLAELAARAPWLSDEVRYEAIAAAVGHDDWRRWPDDAPADLGDAAAGEAFALGQLLVHAQHDAFHRTAQGLGLALYGDIPIGLSHRDRWLRRALFLPGHAMGAPPSRTNPDGQAWGYPVLDPDQLAPGGAARAFLTLRLDALLAAYDGLRIDHPHGWVCPWVYRTDEADPAIAVQRGARLHESPDLPDHPALARYARVRPDQIDRSQPRHGDAWVASLEPAQVDRYAATFDLLVERTRAHGLDPDDLVIEVLSTCPRPLAAVLARHHLGRFRVTQKARVDDPGDVYRSDNAAADDWIMVGNHDTPPLAMIVERWRGTDEASRRAAYLATRLTDATAPDAAGRRAALAAELERDPRALATAMIAELFVGPARHVQIFWADLFGARDVYNRPGIVDDANWSLRVPDQFAAVHARAVADGAAPDLGAAIALALVARGHASDADGAAIVAALCGGRREMTAR